MKKEYYYNVQYSMSAVIEWALSSNSNIK